MRPRTEVLPDGSVELVGDRPHFKLRLDGTRDLLFAPWNRRCGLRLARERRARLGRKVTPTKAAALIGVTVGRWRVLESGAEYPRGPELQALDRLGFDVGYVLLGAGHRLQCRDDASGAEARNGR